MRSEAWKLSIYQDRWFWVKALATKPDDQSPSLNMVEERTDSYKLSSDSVPVHVTRAHTNAHDKQTLFQISVRKDGLTTQHPVWNHDLKLKLCPESVSSDSALVWAKTAPVFPRHSSTPFQPLQPPLVPCAKNILYILLLCSNLLFYIHMLWSNLLYSLFPKPIWIDQLKKRRIKDNGSCRSGLNLVCSPGWP